MGGPGGPMGMRPNQMGRGPPGGQFGGGGPGPGPGPGGFPQQAQHEMLMRAQQMQNQQMQQRSQAALAAGGAQRGGAGGGQPAGGAGGAPAPAGGKLTESQQEILAMEAKEKALQKKAKQWSALAGNPSMRRTVAPVSNEYFGVLGTFNSRCFFRLASRHFDNTQPEGFREARFGVLGSSGVVILLQS